MVTTTSVSEGTRRRLMRMKLEENARSIDALLEVMLTQYRMTKLRDASDLVRRRMDEKNMTPDKLVD